MKFFLIFFTISFFTNCRAQKNEDIKGFLEIKVYPKFSEKESFTFTQNENIYAKIEKDTLYLNNLKLSFFDTDPELLQKYLNTNYLYPDYGIWFIKCNKDNNGDFFYYINENKVFIKGKGMSFISYKNFLSTKLIRLNDNTPLLINKDENSSKIITTESYDYELVSYCDDWIRVKTSDRFLEPGDESYESLGILHEGWVKWIKNDTILIDIIFD